MSLDFTIVLSAFATIFLAEFGDKTQLAVVTMAASSGRPWSVFLGAAFALAAVTALGAAAGQAAARWIPPDLLPRLAGTLFIVVGIWMIAKP